MVSIQQNIYYHVDFENQTLSAYDNFKNFREVHGNGELLRSKKLKHYYGTIYCLYKFTESGAFISYWEGRMKEIDQIRKNNKLDGYILKKIVITDYNEFKKRFEPEEEEEDTFFDTTTPKRSFF